jgi:hypothetical protein
MSSCNFSLFFYFIFFKLFFFWLGFFFFIFISKPLSYWESLYGTPPLYGDQAIVSEHTQHTVLTNHCPAEWFHIASHKDAHKNFDQTKILMFRKVSQKPSTMLDHPLVRAHWI